MKQMKIHVLNSKELVNKTVSEHLIKFVREHKTGVLGLATGSTPIGIYEALVKDHKENNTDYSQIRTINLDEYVNLDQNHPESYYSFMHRNLFDHINVKPEHIHLPNGNEKDLEMACKSYNDVLKNNQPDIQILGIGANGHIGFNEPGTSFDSSVHIIELQEQTRLDNARFFDSMDDVPKKAITMGIKNIMDAKRIILIAFGENKSEAVYQMVKGKVTENLPASILQKHNNVEIYLDESAASKLF